jgi:hypothetical protein
MPRPGTPSTSSPSTATVQELADEAFRDLFKKHRRPTTLKDMLRESARSHPANDRKDAELVTLGFGGRWLPCYEGLEIIPGPAKGIEVDGSVDTSALAPVVKLPD